MLRQYFLQIRAYTKYFEDFMKNFNGNEFANVCAIYSFSEMFLFILKIEGRKLPG
jgi:hypothetical protein